MMTETTASTEPLWTAQEVAAYLQVAEGTVNQWVKLGKIPVVKVGALNRFRRSEIDAWLARNAKPVAEPAA
jgi:excisionase family DNA binding protein